jgi:hypothetical protein
MEHRIVIVDRHIVVQWQSGTEWNVCDKLRKPHNDATDLAVYPNTPANLKRARQIAGEQAQVIAPTEFLISGPVGTEWCISSDCWNSRYQTQVEAVAALAKSVK